MKKMGLAVLLAVSLVACGGSGGGGGSDTDPVAPSGSQVTVSAGEDVTVPARLDVMLRGEGSDPDGQPVTFLWSITSQPAGSAIALDDPAAARASFTPGVAGIYEFKLTASDGTTQAEDSVIVTVFDDNLPPVATISKGPPERGAAGLVALGAFVELRGDASRDPNGGALSYLWEFASKPEDSTLTLSSNNRSSIFFIPDVAGNYSVRLTVSDGLVSSSTVANTEVIAVDSMSISPEDQSISLGQTEQYTAKANVTGGGERDISQFVLWGSSDEAVATIAADGFVESVDVGATTIQANFGFHGAQTMLTVTSSDYVSLHITGDGPFTTLTKGDSVQLALVGTTSTGDEVDITQRANWRVSMGSAVTVSNAANAKAHVEAVSKGPAVVEARLGSSLVDTIYILVE